METTRNRRALALSRRPRLIQGMFLVWAAVGGVLVFSLLFDEMSLEKYFRMRRHAQQLEHHIFQLDRSNAALRRDLRRIRDEPGRIESLARERLGMVRPGETVYQVVQPQAEKS